MSNENKKVQNEQKPEQQPATPAAQVELSDEELKQVVGGFNPQPDPPGAGAWPPGPSIVAPEI